MLLLILDWSLSAGHFDGFIVVILAGRNPVTEAADMIGNSNVALMIVASATTGDFFHETVNFWKFNTSSVDSCSS